MTTSFIIVSWNVRENLVRCLRSIMAHEPSSDVIVVDNASLDGSGEAATAMLGSDRVLRNSSNRGFATAVNQGIAQSSGDLIILLNPDTDIGPTTVDAITRAFDDEDPPAIVGVRLTNQDGSVQPSVRRFPSIVDQMLILLKLHRILPKLPPLRRYFMDGFDYERAADVDQVMGACFAFRRELVKTIGVFDEHYFLWFEEVDYCARAIEHGMRVRYIPDGTVTHVRGASFAQVAALRRQGWFIASMLRYFAVHAPIWQQTVILVLTPISLLFAGLVDLLRLGRRNYPSTP